MKPSGSPVSYDNIQNQLKVLLKACRDSSVDMPDHIGLHSFHVGAINHLDGEGVDMHVIPRQARHKDIRSTAGYAGNYHSNMLAGVALL